MLQILVYSDSLSWGIIPGTRQRLPFDERWPGVLENELNARGKRRVRVIEDCLNGRRTVWDDPFKTGRNGLVGLGERIEACAPLALVVVMLGTNDFQSMHPHNAWHSAQGIAAIIRAIRQAPVEPGMPVAPILVVCPPPIVSPKGPIAPKFAGGELKCVGLTEAYRDVAASLACAFLDAGSVISSSQVDGVHIDAKEHLILGRAVAEATAALI
jgi:lysophospholipase L1-like esterase